MNGLIFITLNIVLLLCAVIKSEKYDDNQDDAKDDTESFESDSNEVLNRTLQEKSKRNEDSENAFATVIIPRGQKYVSNEMKSNNKSSYPYAVSIQKKGSHYASGALVDKKWILTAAGEFYNVRELIKIFRARLGSVNCKKEGVLLPLRKIEIHPLYSYKEPKFDLALIRIARPINFSEDIRPINLSPSGYIVSPKVQVVYWPRVIINDKILPGTAKERIKQNSMRVSKQSIIPWKKCKALLQTYNFTIGASSMCLEPIQSFHTPCMPDTGAPVVINGSLWGITSGWTSEDCIEHLSPTIVTRTSLSLMRSWLDSL